MQTCDILSVASEQAQAKAGSSQSACGVEDVLQLLRILFIIGGDPHAHTRTFQEGTDAHIPPQTPLPITYHLKIICYLILLASCSENVTC